MSKYTVEQYRNEAKFAELRGDGSYTADMLRHAADILAGQASSKAITNLAAEVSSLEAGITAMKDRKATPVNNTEQQTEWPSDANVETACRASYESDGNSKWDKLLDCWKVKHRSAMRAALQSVRPPTQAVRADDEGKQQWDELASILGADGDNVDAVFVAARKAVAKPAAGVVSDEPIGWVFQHDETGRMCFCENDGINTPDVFAKNNPRHSLVSAAYASRHARQVPDLSKEQVIALLTVACREMDKINSAIRAMLSAAPPAPKEQPHDQD